MDKIRTYFSDLSSRQYEQFSKLSELYRYWNDRINVVSRKDIDNLKEHHVLHSLAIAKFVQFDKGTKILDVGTGGGFPGIPLAILFPDCKFKLIDSIAKKIKVVSRVAEALELQNVEAEHIRVQQEKAKYDFVVSRAVTNLSELVKISRKTIAKEKKNHLSNGLICLKGGDLAEELKPFETRGVHTVSLKRYFQESFFETKSLVYLPL